VNGMNLGTNHPRGSFQVISETFSQRGKLIAQVFFAPTFERAKQIAEDILHLVPSAARIQISQTVEVFK